MIVTPGALFTTNWSVVQGSRRQFADGGVHCVRMRMRKPVD
jgi:hypothetical protein